MKQPDNEAKGTGSGNRQAPAKEALRELVARIKELPSWNVSSRCYLGSWWSRDRKGVGLS